MNEGYSYQVTAPDGVNVIGEAVRGTVKTAEVAARQPSAPALDPSTPEGWRAFSVRHKAQQVQARPGAAGAVAARSARAVVPTRRELPFTGEDVAGWMSAYLGHFVAFGSQAAADAVTLWALHTHFRDSEGVLAFAATPRLAVMSSQPGSGKSTVLECLNVLCPATHGLDTEPSEAGVTATLGREHATVLLDEADVLFGTDKRKSAIRAILNAGYTRNGTVPKVRGGKVDRVKVFGPVAFAGLDVLETGTGESLKALLTRCVIIRLARSPRRLPDLLTGREEVNGQRMPYTDVGAALGARCAQWAAYAHGLVTSAEPEMPEGVYGRSAQIWGPLLAVADAIGGDWPQRARQACVELALFGGVPGPDGDSGDDGLADVLGSWAAG